MERLKEIKNGAPVPNTFSAAEYERRLTALRTTQWRTKKLTPFFTPPSTTSIIIAIFYTAPLAVPTVWP